MGQKVNPHGLRVGIIKDWDSKWYANKKNFADLLVEDYQIREFVKTKLYTSGIAKIAIARKANNKVNINIFTSKPGMVVGRGGELIEALKKDLEKLTGKTVYIDISEVARPDRNAQLVAEGVAFSLERRVSFRRAMKQAMGRAMKSGVQGIKIMVSGRLGGAEIARTENYSLGNVPLQTLRANIEYGFAEANTTYGKIGVKVWINKGEILQGMAQDEVVDKNSKRPPRKKTRRPRKSSN
ncbi:MAG: 30S ribosomal protein S3 [Peptostreptococcaceae bacterium]|nr:30S ribosomal protein S3 [Peptostreptococcaceae bacterium]